MARKSWSERNNKKNNFVKELNFHTSKEPPTDYTVAGQRLLSVCTIHLTPISQYRAVLITEFGLKLVNHRDLLALNTSDFWLDCSLYKRWRLCPAVFLPGSLFYSLHKNQEKMQTGKVTYTKSPSPFALQPLHLLGCS